MGEREFDIVLWGGNWRHGPPHRAPSGQTLWGTPPAAGHEDNSIALDVAVVWRIVDGKFAEAWDIPSAFTLAA